MKYSKLSVSLETRVAEELRQVVGARRLSAFVNEAVRRELQAYRMRKMLDQMDEQFGPIPDDIQSQVDSLPWPD